MPSIGLSANGGYPPFAERPIDAMRSCPWALLGGQLLEVVFAKFIKKYPSAYIPSIIKTPRGEVTAKSVILPPKFMTN